MMCEGSVARVRYVKRQCSVKETVARAPTGKMPSKIAREELRRPRGSTNYTAIPALRDSAGDSTDIAANRE